MKCQIHHPKCQQSVSIGGGESLVFGVYQKPVSTNSWLCPTFSVPISLNLLCPRLSPWKQERFLVINSQALIWLHFLATDFTNHNSISGAYLLLIVCRGCLIKLSQKKSLKRSSFAEKYGNGKIWPETVWSKLTDRPGAPVSTSYNMVWWPRKFNCSQQKGP